MREHVESFLNYLTVEKGFSGNTVDAATVVETQNTPRSDNEN